MKFELSRCICIETPDNVAAAAFYRDVLGMEFSLQEGNSIELKSGERLLYFDSSTIHRTIFEFVVDDLEAARGYLESNGCSAIRWEGQGKPCYMRDPFGNIFNLYKREAT